VELVLPQPRAVAVAATRIGGDEQLRRVGIDVPTHAVPPAANRLNGELGGVVIDAHIDPSLVARDVVDTVRDHFAELSIDEVVGAYGLRVALRLPLSAVVVEIADQLLLLGVD